MKTKFPWWIYVILVITILTSLVGVFGGYVDGTKFYAEFSADLWSQKLVKHLAGMWASKNVGIIAVIVFCLVKNYRQGLAMMFLFKFISDTIDILFINVLYRDGDAAGIVSNIITWVILGGASFIAYLYFDKNTKQ